MILLAQVQQVPHLRGLARQASFVVIGNPHETAGIAKRQRTKEQRVHHSEYGRARPDPESDDQNGKGRETGIPPQRPQSYNEYPGRDYPIAAARDRFYAISRLCLGRGTPAKG